nr:MAG TPA: hypothetical protein [Caudoviricetes sp.]
MNPRNKCLISRLYIRYPDSILEGLHPSVSTPGTI